MDGRLRFTFDRKSIPMVAWYMLSKESYMNLVISDVLPTIYITPHERISTPPLFASLLFSSLFVLSWCGGKITTLFSKKNQSIREGPEISERANEPNR